MNDENEQTEEFKCVKKRSDELNGTKYDYKESKIQEKDGYIIDPPEARVKLKPNISIERVRKLEQKLLQKLRGNSEVVK